MLDNFFTGSKANIEALLDYHNFELSRHDVTKEPTVMLDEGLKRTIESFKKVV